MSVQLHRAVDILELLAQAEGPLALHDIAAQLDLPKSAAHRLLQVWVERGYLEQELVLQRYTATLKLAILGFAHLNATGIRDVCYPELRHLAKETGELARLAVVDGDSLTWVAEAQGARDGLRYDGNLGRSAVLHATAAGKVWLATLPEAEVARLIVAQGFPGTPGTGPRAARSLQALLTELQATQRQGYATAIEEAAVGVNAVAAPVFMGERSKTCAGAVILVGPSARMTSARIGELIPLLTRAANRLSALWPVRRHLATDPEQRDAVA